MKSIVDYYVKKPEEVFKLIDCLPKEEREDAVTIWRTFTSYSYNSLGKSLLMNSDSYPKTKDEFVSSLLKRVRIEKNKKPYNRFNILDIDG